MLSRMLYFQELFQRSSRESCVASATLAGDRNPPTVIVLGHKNLRTLLSVRGFGPRFTTGLPCSLRPKMPPQPFNDDYVRRLVNCQGVRGAFVPQRYHNPVSLPVPFEVLNCR